MGKWTNLLMEYFPLGLLSTATFCLLLVSIFSDPRSSHLTTFWTPNATTCPLCSRCPFRSISSTPKDLIISRISDPKFPIKEGILSLRSTGCRATIMIFTTITQIEGSIRQLLDNCGVILIPVNEVPTNAEMFLLALSGKKYDRVLQVDISNTYFQFDPFTDFVDRSGVHISVSKRQLWTFETDFEQIKSCYGDEISKSLANQTKFVPEVIGGDFDQYIAFLHLIENEKCNSDVAAINKLLSGHINNVIVHHCGDGVESFGWCGWDAYTINQFGVITPEGSPNEPGIVQQYRTFWPGLIEYIDQQCGIETTEKE